MSKHRNDEIMCQLYRVKVLDNEEGDRHLKDGHNCPNCKNKGIIYRLNAHSECTAYPCPDCAAIRHSLYIQKVNGLEGKTVQSYKATDTWQQNALNKVNDYINDNSGAWLYFGGQSGAGKTHLCTAAMREKVFKYQLDAHIMNWIEDGGKLKRIVNDQDNYTKEIDKFKNADILYIDDFFKCLHGDNITAADLRLAFEILNSRYTRNKPTIISSELLLTRINEIDNAVGGRIAEKCGRFVLNIRQDDKKNYRQNYTE